MWSFSLADSFANWLPIATNWLRQGRGRGRRFAGAHHATGRPVGRLARSAFVFELCKRVQPAAWPAAGL